MLHTLFELVGHLSILTRICLSGSMINAILLSYVPGPGYRLNRKLLAFTTVSTRVVLALAVLDVLIILTRVISTVLT